MSMQPDDFNPSSATDFLTLSAMRSWAHTFPDTAVLGKARHDDACPLQAYLCRFYPGHRVFVNSSFYEALPLEGGIMVSTLPGWARRFVYFVDTGHAVGEPVTAGKVLHYLDFIEQEAGVVQPPLLEREAVLA